MDLVTLRNSLREWFRTESQAVPLLQPLPLVVPNQGGTHGVNETWMRFSIQTGAAGVVGIGADTKRRRRIGRVFVEVFGEEAVGDGSVSEIVNAVEQIWRDAMVAASAPHQDIRVGEPYSFERSEDGRYCQVVSVPIEVDHIS